VGHDGFSGINLGRDPKKIENYCLTALKSIYPKSHNLVTAEGLKMTGFFLGGGGQRFINNVPKQGVQHYTKYILLHD